MTECPKCGAEISHLVNICSVWKRFNMELDNEGYPAYKFSKEWDGSERPSWHCPSCDEELFHDENQATKFLKEER